MGMRFELADDVTSDSSADDIEVGIACALCQQSAPMPSSQAPPPGRLPQWPGPNASVCALGKISTSPQKKPSACCTAFAKEMIVVQEDVAAPEIFWPTP